MFGVNYFDDLFAFVRIPAKFWETIKIDLRYDGSTRNVEGFVILLLFPVLSALASFRYGVALEQQFYSLLIPTATLFVGFSINSILLLLRYSNSENSSTSLINQTRNMITYLVYLGVLLVGLAIFGYIITNNPASEPSIIMLVTTSISLFLIFHFLIVVLFLPARIFTIVENTVES